MEVYLLNENGVMEIVTLGNDYAKGQVFQFVVPANSWFASRPMLQSQFCFVGCTVAPGFEFEDFELADADELMGVFPQYKDIVRELCR